MKTLSLIAFLALGISPGQVQGEVTDTSGKPVAAVTVTAKDARGKSAGTAKSDKNGTYTFKALPPGDYTLEFSAKGYETEKQSNVSVEAGQVADVDITLRPRGKSLRPVQGGW